MNVKNQFLVKLGILSMLVVLSFGCSTSSDPVPTTGLAVKMTTSSAGGNFAPRNIVAVWIETDAGVFVKSLTVYANIRIDYLTHWNTASNGNKTDAVTGSTRSSHGTITSYWNGKDKNGTLMPDGNYKVCMELTDKDFTGNFATFPFTKGTTAISLTPANQNSFSSVSIKWTPL